MLVGGGRVSSVTLGGTYAGGNIRVVKPSSWAAVR